MKTFIKFPPLQRNKVIHQCEIMQFKLQFKPTITLNSDMNCRKYMIENKNDFIMVDYLKSDNDVHTFKYTNCSSKNMNDFFDGSEGVFVLIDCEADSRESQNIILTMA